MIQKNGEDSPESSSEIYSNVQIRVMEPKQIKQNNPFSIIRAEPPNMLGNDQFVDDEFKLQLGPNNKNLTIKRLCDIFTPKSPLFFDIKTGKNLSNPTKKKINVGKPTYLSELNMLPFEHFRTLIEPQFVSEKGYYHVVMWKDGVMVKEIIDDTVYYDEKLQKIECNPQLQNYPWIHIILKAWAKRNKSYEASQSCLGFDFIKTFTFPDWQFINPSKQNQEYLNHRFSKATTNSDFMICKTKTNPNVGLFGFTPDCASFIIRNYYQEYGQIFLIIQPFVYDRWNKIFSNAKSNFPEEAPQLKSNQFFIPMAEFLNVFYLIYVTKNKYYFPKDHKNKIPPRLYKDIRISYEKYLLNVDARDTKAIVLGFQLTDDTQEHYEGKQLPQIPVSINFFFPNIKIFDIVNKPRHGSHMLGDLVVPWAKIMIAQNLQTGNVDASYVESVKEKILDYGENLIGFSMYNPSYEYVIGEYFQGYSNELTYNLELKPGKYYMRIKIEQKQSQYRCQINSTAINGKIKIFDPKLNDKEQLAMLKDCLISKAKLQKKFITYINPIKKGSWIICRNEFQTIGYGYIVVQTIKHAQNRIFISFDPKKLREHGYEIKGSKKDQNQNKIAVESDQTILILLKHVKNWQGSQRIWPPPGIQFTKVPKNPPK